MNYLHLMPDTANEISQCINYLGNEMLFLSRRAREAEEENAGRSVTYVT